MDKSVIPSMDDYITHWNKEMSLSIDLHYIDLDHISIRNNTDVIVKKWLTKKQEFAAYLELISCQPERFIDPKCSRLRTEAIMDYQEKLAKKEFRVSFALEHLEGEKK